MSDALVRLGGAAKFPGANSLMLHLALVAYPPARKGHFANGSERRRSPPCHQRASGILAPAATLSGRPHFAQAGAGLDCPVVRASARLA